MKLTVFIDPYDGVKPLTKELYSSWSDSAYSPRGVFNTQLRPSDILLEKGWLNDIWTDKGIERDNTRFIDIHYQMKNNRFTDMKVLFEDFDKAEGITTYDLYKSLWTMSAIEYDYNIHNINPITNEMVGKYIDDNPKYKDVIKNLILATKFIQYTNYLPSSKWALYLIGSPEKFGSKAMWTNGEKFKDVKEYQKIATRISRIPDDIIEGRSQGKSYGKLTNDAQQILKDILKVQKLDGILETSYGSK